MRNIMHKVVIRRGDLETVLFVAAPNAQRAKEYALAYLNIYGRAGVSFSVSEMYDGHVYTAYTINTKTGVMS